ncbi:helix-turn-helix domain-containing protein [Natribacillus halophilus]|uniref:Transcriptional regulator, contains XRE-family HTH domain n=1 Tax=Natribacillus halophilus TaxID=549003 RepID=A0A1G8Q4M4_9BACI|nr:helix-turn-helix transcriptional regulator [Natribacillus halophilus]SDI99476.1 Transcriptional regulator, contains XRE-family HTH domain [Natribacillus halophilus]
MSHFSERLKYTRELKKEEYGNWTQQYVAQRIGVARTTYTAYERGTKQPPLDTINTLADLLDVSTDYLLGHEKKTIYRYKRPDKEHSLYEFYKDRNISRDEKAYLEEELAKYRRLKQKWNPDDK